MEKATVAKNKIFLASVIIAALNPIFAGLVMGLTLYSEPEFRREGKIVTLFALAWGMIILFLLAKFRQTLFP